jgi:TPP-dependent pyruvate/acetoin dehydrogenase alpha subunit
MSDRARPPLVGGAVLPPQAVAPLQPDHLLALYRTMVRIRKVELLIERLHRQGRMVGSFHSSLGQEATAAGVCAALRPVDLATSTHRGHGHAIAKGMPVAAILAELLGHREGSSGGRGGSMHLHHRPSGFLGENAIVAGGMPWAAGAAWAARRQGRDVVAVSFVGDGAAAQGLFSETLRMARTWGAPYLVVCENNHLAHSMPAERIFGEPGSIANFARAFGVDSAFVPGDDVASVAKVAGSLVAAVRASGRPAFLEVEVWRVRAHSLNDPDYRYRPKGIGDEHLRAHDPIANAAARLGLDQAERAEIDREIEAEITVALREASGGMAAPGRAALSRVYSAGLEREVYGAE